MSSQAKKLYTRLNEANWTDVKFDEKQSSITCPQGKILYLAQDNFVLNFIVFIQQTNEYRERTTYKQIIFPKSFDLLKHLYVRRNGNYKISSERQFKKIVNPLNMAIRKIKVVKNDTNKRISGKTLTLSQADFQNAVKDADTVNKKKQSYAVSIENYLAGIESLKYGGASKKKTTYISPGEINFCIERLNLRTKKTKKDIEKYVDQEDIRSVEALSEKFIHLDVFSNDFLRRLNDFFIKERLRDIIDLGKEILELKSTNLELESARKIISTLELDEVKQLENLWQKYFERYLLYLIFSYKKIFPKIELKDIDGDKKYPDFIGVNHYNGLDVIEIKTHLSRALTWDNSHKNFYFSSEMSKAIVQTTNYLDSITRARFKKHYDRNKITKHTDEENLYHPRGIIVISSFKNLTTKKGEEDKLERDFTKLRNSLSNLEILTFDEIIDITDAYLKNIVSST